MPTYEYQCPACGKHFEIMQKMSDPPIKTCPECHKRGLQKLISGGSFQLKGAGWYATDYSKSKSSSHDKSDDSKKGDESKSEKTDKKADKSSTSTDTATTD